MAVLSTIRGKCACFRAKMVEISGQLPGPARGRSERVLFNGKGVTTLMEMNKLLWVLPHPRAP